MRRYFVGRRRVLPSIFRLGLHLPGWQLFFHLLGYWHCKVARMGVYSIPLYCCMLFWKKKKCPLRYNTSRQHFCLEHKLTSIISNGNCAMIIKRRRFCNLCWSSKKCLSGIEHLAVWFHSVVPFKLMHL